MRLQRTCGRHLAQGVANGRGGSFVVGPRASCSVTHFLCLVRAAWCASRPSDRVRSLEWSTQPAALSPPNQRTLHRPSAFRACSLPGHEGYPFTGPHTRSPTSNLRHFSIAGISSAPLFASTERLSYLASANSSTPPP